MATLPTFSNIFTLDEEPSQFFVQPVEGNEELLVTVEDILGVPVVAHISLTITETRKVKRMHSGTEFLFKGLEDIDYSLSVIPLTTDQNNDGYYAHRVRPDNTGDAKLPVKTKKNQKKFIDSDISIDNPLEDDLGNPLINKTGWSCVVFAGLKASEPVMFMSESFATDNVGNPSIQVPSSLVTGNKALFIVHPPLGEIVEVSSGCIVFEGTLTHNPL